MDNTVTATLIRPSSDNRLRVPEKISKKLGVKPFCPVWVVIDGNKIKLYYVVSNRGKKSFIDIKAHKKQTVSVSFVWADERGRITIPKRIVKECLINNYLGAYLAKFHNGVLTIK